MVLGHGQREVLEYGENLSGSCILGCQTVTAAYDDGGVGFAIEAFLDVEIEGFAVCSGLFGAVEHCYAFGCGRYGCEEVFGGERTVEMYGNQTDFFAFGVEVVDRFLCGLGN